MVRTGGTLISSEVDRVGTVINVYLCSLNNAALNVVSDSIRARAASANKRPHPKSTIWIVILTPSHCIMIVGIEFAITRDAASSRVLPATATLVVVQLALRPVRGPRDNCVVSVNSSDVACSAKDHTIQAVIKLSAPTDLVAPRLQATIHLHGLAIMSWVESALTADVILSVAADAALGGAVVMARAAICRDQRVAHWQRDIRVHRNRWMKFCNVGADGIIRGRIHAVAKSLWRGARDKDIVNEGVAAVLVVALQHAAWRRYHTR